MSKHIVIDARIRQSSTGRPVDRLLDRLQKLDKQNLYTVITSKSDPWQPKAKNFRVKQVRYPIFSLNPLQQLAYSEYLWRLKPDLVHFTLTGQQPLFYFGKQITFTHDLTMLEYPRAESLPRWLNAIRMQAYMLLLWAAHRKAVLTHTPTEYIADRVNKKYLHTNRRTAVTYEAADTLKPTKAKKPELEGLDEFIMYVGAAFPHKNLEKLVDAFGLLIADNPHLKLVFIGKVEYHAKSLKRYVKTKPYASSIAFTGFVSDEELSWFYQNAKCYVFPSLSEGFGLPALEAMTHGCPVASSNATCLPEVYGKAAEYFDPEDINDMSKAVQKVIGNDKRRKELITAGKKQAAKYSWDKMTKEILDIYNQALSN